MDIHILGAKRTPIGAFNGALSSYTAPQLGAKAIAAAVAEAGVEPSSVTEVVMGNVLSAGIGQAPARQASIAAGLLVSTGATTVNKVCGSGMKAVMLASQSLALGDSSIAVAGGMEAMSKAPYLLEKARSGYRLGHGRLTDAVIHDGLWDPYKDVHMGICGELCAEKEGIGREEQDRFAAASYERARAAQASNAFAAEMAPVDGIAEDEEPKKGDTAKMPRLKPAFKPGGTITAANASKINDGAAALVLAAQAPGRDPTDFRGGTSSPMGSVAGAKSLGRIKGWATFSQEPELFTTAPAGAIEKLLARVGWKKEEVDLYEINEAFAVVSLAVMKRLGLPHEKVNVNGGAVALGHPIGASGARILVTLLRALEARGLKRGVASICLGGGEAVAVAIER